jgi:dihydroflavonol-4-reductase
VVTACLQCGVRRMVHFSSIHALQQKPLDQPLDESRPRVGEDAYAYDRSKARAEAEALAGNDQGLEVVVVNPTGVIGPGDFKPSAMGQVFLDLQHRRLHGLVHGGFNWVDVRDVVAGAIRAAEAGRPGETYILGGHWLSIRDLARLAEEVSGVQAPIFTAPMWLARLAAPPALLAARLTNTRPLFTPEALGALRGNRRVECGKAANELGHQPRPVRETVEDIYGWFASNGMLEQ